MASYVLVAHDFTAHQHNFSPPPARQIFARGIAEPCTHTYVITSAPAPYPVAIKAEMIYGAKSTECLNQRDVQYTDRY
jgi:hypothetical protein